MMTSLPSIAPSRANLPRTYEAARAALAECQNIDECRDWADKAAALASYAKQAEDETLLRMAARIKARATRRAGELLKQVTPAKGGNRRSDQWEADHPLMSRTKLRWYAAGRVMTRPGSYHVCAQIIPLDLGGADVTMLHKRHVPRPVDGLRAPSRPRSPSQGQRSSLFTTHKIADDRRYPALDQKGS